MTIQYLGYDKIVEDGQVFIHAYGRLEDGRKFWLRIPITDALYDDVSKDVIEGLAKDEVLNMRPEYIAQ